MTDKQKYQAERWKLIIAESMQRDIKLKDWLRLRGITKDAYYYWLHKLQKENIDNVLSELPMQIQQEPTFVEIPKPENCCQAESIPIVETPTNPVAIIKANNVQIELFQNASPEIIRELMAVINHV